jgi:peptide/nickel transport system substrate-binding protein
MRRLRTTGVLVAAGLLAAACSSSSSSGSGTSGSTSGSTTVTISNENGALWTCGFNPLLGSDQLLSFGFVYEPLVYVNPLQNGKTTPMLATSWKWGAGNKSLTFTIRPNVKWNDGTPMTAADVAYTFNLMKKYPALDLPGVWAVLSSVTASGSQVAMNFKAPAVPDFYYIADQTPIMPEHVWSKIANPVTYANPHPVGTGPYKVNPCSGQNVTYTANPNYWQPGLPKIKKVEYPAFTSNNTANDQLANGQAQWGSQYIPNIKEFYTAKSPDFHYWFPPTVNVSVVPNLTNPLLANVKVRQAISYAIDRAKVSSIGESSYEPPANQAGIVTPTFTSWLDTSLASKYHYTYDAVKAKQILQSAGFKMGSDGIMANSKGQKLSFSIINIGDYSDWVASVQVIQQNLKAVGIQITPDNLTNTAFTAALYAGKYQLAYYDQQSFGPGPYYELRNWLLSANTAPIGQTAASNYERYKNPATDALINSYAATTSTTEQHNIVNQLQQVMLADLPIIPVVEAVDWYQYSTAHHSGWPTPGNPYSQPSAYAFPDMEQVLLHLTPG